MRRMCGGKATGNGARFKKFRDSVPTMTDIAFEEYNVFPVRIFDPKGNLKQEISAEELIARPMQEAVYAD